MTSKLIAEYLGKSERTVRDWVCFSVPFCHPY